MNNAMTNNDRAAQIADYVIDLEERISLWKSLMVQKTGQPIAVVESIFETRLGQIQTPLKAQDHHVELLRNVRASTEDSRLVAILYEGIFRKSQVM
jgi:hypothetical protein